MGNTEHTSSATRAAGRAPLKESIPAVPTNPPKQEYQVTAIEGNVISIWVPDPNKDPRTFGSFIEQGFYMDCADLYHVFPEECKFYPLLQKHAEVCMGRHCKGFGREGSSGIGRGRSIGKPPNS